MENFNDFFQINEGSVAEARLLHSMYWFYSDKYVGDLTKLKRQIEMLVRQNELTRKSVDKFYTEMNIDGDDEEGWEDDEVANKKPKKKLKKHAGGGMTIYGCGSFGFGYTGKC